MHVVVLHFSLYQVRLRSSQCIEVLVSLQSGIEINLLPLKLVLSQIGDHFGEMDGDGRTEAGGREAGGGKDGRIVKYNHEYRLTGEEAVIPGHLGSVRAISQG